jgi:replicative DNA helicase
MSEHIRHELALVAGAIAHPGEVWALLDEAPRDALLDPLLGSVWGVIADLAHTGQAPELARVQAELVRQGLAERIGPSMAELATGGTVAQVRAAAARVRAAADQRRFLGLAQGVMQDLTSLPPDQALPAWQAFLDQGLRACGERGQRRTDLHAGMIESVARAEARARGEITERSWPLGVEGLDHIWTLAPKELVTLGGPSGGGKSALAQWIGLAFVRKTGRGVLYIPLADIDAAAMSDRAVAHLSHRTSREVARDIPHDSALRAMRRALEESAYLRHRFTVVDGCSTDVEDLVQIIRQERLRMRQRGVELGLVVTDYAQTITSRQKGLDDLDVLRVVSQTLKIQVAQALEVAVVLPSQYNRQYMPGQRPPVTGDLYGGSVMEHYSDVVALIHPTKLPHVPALPENDWRNRLRRFELHLPKNRTGSPGMVPLVADLATYSYWAEKACPHYAPPPPKPAKSKGKEDG